MFTTRIPRISDRGTVIVGEYAVQYSRSWLRVLWNEPLPPMISRARYGSSTPAPSPGASWYTSEYADVSYSESHCRKRSFGDGIRWYWGKDSARPDITVITAYRGGATAPARVLELASMRIAEGAVAAEQLWLIGSPENRTSEGPQVFLCDVDSEEVHRIDSIDEVDISAHCWPVGPEPLDHGSYVQYCLRRLDGMQFSDSVSNAHARYVGQWPKGRIHLSFKHTRYPNLTLVARLNLYDEQATSKTS